MGPRYGAPRRSLRRPRATPKRSANCNSSSPQRKRFIARPDPPLALIAATRRFGLALGGERRRNTSSRCWSSIAHSLARAALRGRDPAKRAKVSSNRRVQRRPGICGSHAGDRESRLHPIRSCRVATGPPVFSGGRTLQFGLQTATGGRRRLFWESAGLLLLFESVARDAFCSALE